MERYFDPTRFASFEEAAAYVVQYLGLDVVEADLDADTPSTPAGKPTRPTWLRVIEGGRRD